MLGQMRPGGKPDRPDRCAPDMPARGKKTASVPYRSSRAVGANDRPEVEVELGLVATLRRGILYIDVLQFSADSSENSGRILQG